jgi:hypothetical protein
MTYDMADLFLKDLRDHTARLESMSRPVQDSGQHDAAFAH